VTIQFHSQDAVVWYGSESSARMHLEKMAKRLSRGDDVAVIQSLFETHKSQQEMAPRFGDYENYITAYDNVAVVPVRGSLYDREDSYTRYYGEMTYETLANIMAILDADESIDTTLLDFDSPGGLVSGIDIATDAMQAAQANGMHIVAHTSSMMLSAAMRIGAFADEVIAAKNAEVGSVGVVMVHQDVSKMLDEFGITMTVFRLGEEKALGSPYEKLDEKAIESINRRMEHAYTGIIDAVAEGRGISSEYVRTNIASGRVFTAQEGLDLRLVDRIEPFNAAFNHAHTPLSEGITPGATQMSIKPIAVLNPTAPPAAPVSSAQEAPVVDPVVEPTAEQLALAAAAAGVDEAAPAPAATVAPGLTIVEDSGTESEDEGGDPEPEPVAADTGIGAVLAATNEQLIQARVELQVANAKVAELQEGSASLRTVAIEQTENLRIRLGLSAGSEDLKAMSDSALLTAYQSARDDFVARFKAGPTSSVPKEDTKLPAAVVTNIDRGARRATMIGAK
jgi:signal peptide peptidase SppA